MSNGKKPQGFSLPLADNINADKLAKAANIAKRIVQNFYTKNENKESKNKKLLNLVGKLRSLMHSSTEATPNDGERTAAAAAASNAYHQLKTSAEKRFLLNSWPNGELKKLNNYTGSVNSNRIENEIKKVLAQMHNADLNSMNAVLRSQKRRS